MDENITLVIFHCPLRVDNHSPYFYFIIPLLPTKELYFRQALTFHPPESILNLLKLSMFSYLLPCSQIPNSPLQLTTITPHHIWISYFIHSSVILFTRNIIHLDIAIQINYILSIPDSSYSIMFLLPSKELTSARHIIFHPSESYSIFSS